MEKDFLAEEMENLDNSAVLQSTFTICGVRVDAKNLISVEKTEKGFVLNFEGFSNAIFPYSQWNINSFLEWLKFHKIPLIDNRKELEKLAKMVVSILDLKAHNGCDCKNWDGFQNGNGEGVGKDINKLIKFAKKYC